MKLSEKQQDAHDKVLSFAEADEGKSFAIAGFAGAGKSTIAAKIANSVDAQFLAYTGKAANVLREKGCDNASTIHNALYVLVKNDVECNLCMTVGKVDGDKCTRCNGKGYYEGEPKFVLNEESDLKYAPLVIVDEYSMLPSDIRVDLEKVCKKILYIGDPFQLPPVSGECDIKPDIFLEEIHRQALGSHIIKYATDVREGKSLSFCSHDDFIYKPVKSFDPDAYELADQIIVGFNKTREAWNKRFRLKLGFGNHPLPCAGDKLICTKNNKERGLFNGMIGYSKTDARQVSFEEIKIDFEDFDSISAWDGNFKDRDPNPVGKNRKLDRFDFAYAITCHKSQGSEFDDLLVYNQPVGGDSLERRRWLYTAITRGKKKVSLVQP